MQNATAPGQAQHAETRCAAQTAVGEAVGTAVFVAAVTAGGFVCAFVWLEERVGVFRTKGRAESDVCVCVLCVCLRSKAFS